MLTLAEARALLLDGVRPVSAEELPIAECAGRILAEEVVAARDQPPAPLSAMDGYAVRQADLRPAALLRVIGEAPAGAPFGNRVGPGEAVRIATGGVVPEGADHVVMQENVTRDGDSVRLLELPSPQPFIRLAGCDFAAGETVARAGEMLTPARLALVAAANAGTLRVRRRARLAIFPSGDELREPGTILGAGEIANSAVYAIAAVVRQWGGEAAICPILPDEPQLCEAQLRAAHIDVDIIVTLGGASVGERDSLRPVFERLGAKPVFERIAVQPGKPSWHARFGDGRLLLGLPGNPASAFVCAHLLMKPLLFALTGRDPEAAVSTFPALLDNALPANGLREAFLRAHMHVDAEGRLRATSMDRQDSSLLTPLAAANSLIRRAANAASATPGETIELLPLTGGVF